MTVFTDFFWYDFGVLKVNVLDTLPSLEGCMAARAIVPEGEVDEGEEVEVDEEERDILDDAAADIEAALVLLAVVFVLVDAVAEDVESEDDEDNAEEDAIAISEVIASKGSSSGLSLVFCLRTFVCSWFMYCKMLVT